MIKEFNPELVHIKGESNTVADALGHSEIVKGEPLNELQLTEMCRADKNDLPPFPLAVKAIQCAQQADQDLLMKPQDDSHHSIKDCHAGNKKCSLVIKEGKIAVPEPLQQ